MSKVAIDMTGWKMAEHGVEDSRWTVIEQDLERSNYTGNYWKCICQCGKIKSIRGTELRLGKSKSCGCLARDLRIIDMTGWIMAEHGVPDSRLTVIKPIPPKKWLCHCSCGQEVIVSSANLRNNNTKSCGCLASELIQQRNQENGKIIQIGEKFGNLTVIKDLGLRTQKSRNKQWRWSLCQCACGSKPIEVANNILLNGHKLSCGCLHSYGEFKIKQLLEQHNINYKTEYSFEDLKNLKTNHLLRFDFAIFSEDNKQLLYLIEFDGRQHQTGPEAKWNNRTTLEDIQYRDNLKNYYCYEKQILLKRIPSTDLDVFTYNDIISNKYNYYPVNIEQIKEDIKQYNISQENNE